MNKFIEAAKEQALKSSMDKRYGAVLVHRNKIISSGYNYTTINNSKKKCCFLRV